jgi:putative aminopeptidase FrvX
MRTRIPLISFCFAFMMCTAVAGQVQPGDRVERLLQELSNAPGPSGYEGPVREIVARELRAAGLKVSTDGLGSVIGTLEGPANGPRIMLAPHMDEVGAMVRYITTEGAVATRYLHSHNSMIERSDLDHAVDLLVQILTRLDARTVAEISRF